VNANDACVSKESLTAHLLNVLNVHGQWSPSLRSKVNVVLNALVMLRDQTVPTELSVRNGVKMTNALNVTATLSKVSFAKINHFASVSATVTVSTS